MKKMMTKSLMVFAVIALMASPVLAANGSWTDPSGATGVLISDTGGAGIFAEDLSFSSGVVFLYKADGGTGDAFGIATRNTKGDKAYTTNSGSSKLYVSTVQVDDSSDVAASDVYSSGDPEALGDWNEVGE